MDRMHEHTGPRVRDEPGVTYRTRELPVPDSTVTAGLGGPRALEVLAQLDAQLGDVDPDARALVALSPGEGDGVALTDVTLRDDGILEPPADAIGIVVVTSEDVQLDEDGPVVALRQLVAVLPDGTEVGVVRVGDDPTPRTWSTEDDAEAMRPRDVTANTARRSLGLPTLADVPPIEDLLARAWLVQVAEEALARFDGPEGPREVEPEELGDLARVDPLGQLCAETTGTEHDPAVPPTWEQVHAAAKAGRLQLGSFTVDHAHAAWLDVDGFAQVVDRTLPSTEQLLGTLRVLGEDPLVGWAIDHIAGRGWGVAL
jgi:hypothetical protein